MSRTWTFILRTKTRFPTNSLTLRKSRVKTVSYAINAASSFGKPPKNALMPGHSHRNLVSSTFTAQDEVLSQLILNTSSTASPQPSRSFATLPKMVDVANTQVQSTKLLEKEEFEQFNTVWPELVKFLTEIPEFRDMSETNRWLARVLHYNVPHGKRNRGLGTALAYRYLTDELDEKSVRLSYILGWTVEILQAYFLVSDDIMDHSETRRGRLCWYKVDNMDVAAINDAFLLHGCIFTILKHYFQDKDYYVDLLDIMHDANYKTVYGQSLDTRTGLGRQMETYTMDRYSAIVKYKTSFYSFHLPIALAMAMAGVKGAEEKRQVEKVTLEIGHLFQVQDDYLDCYGDVSITGKIGTDIQDCKCSWLFASALDRVTPAQRDILLENYGQDDPAKVAVVKNLYAEIELPELFHTFEEQSFNLITTHIQQMSPSLPKRLFHEILGKIYRRSS